jgi:hypothetical protein
MYIEWAYPVLLQHYGKVDRITSLAEVFSHCHGDSRIVMTNSEEQERKPGHQPRRTTFVYSAATSLVSFPTFPWLSLRYYFLISSNCVSLYISIYISILYINISIYSYYIFFHTLRTLIHTLFPLRSSPFASYLYIYTHWAAQNDLEIYTHIHSHARTHHIRWRVTFSSLVRWERGSNRW